MRELETTITKKRQVTVRPPHSKVLRGYGAVTPRKRPEDLRKLREEFEKVVAEDVQAEA